MQMRVEGPVFPLTKVAFATALRTGHGRAQQQIDRFGADGLADEILAACVSCPTYDAQCEAVRAPWVVSIVERTNLERQVVQAIEATMPEALCENHSDMDHRSKVLKELAAAGSQDARRLLYSMLVRSFHTADVIGVDQIVDLDGLEGLMRVARQLGRWRLEDPDFYVDGRLDAQLDASTGIPGAREALEQEAEFDADVASYLVGLRAIDERGKTSSGMSDSGIETWSAVHIVAYVNASPKDQCYRFRRWGAQASGDQIEAVFAALLASSDPERVKRLFRCFALTGVPRFDDRLLQWIDHPDAQVQWAAIKAVASTHHGEVRRAAISLIAKGDIASGIALLVNNFDSGDFVRCAEHLTRLYDADEIHHALGPLLDLCEAHPKTETLDCLLYVYEFSPCSVCRGRAVKALIEMDLAPAWVLEEARYDADPDTRNLV